MLRLRPALRSSVAVAVLGCLMLVAPATVVGGDARGDPHRLEALRHMVRQDCGSCHGLTLKGGLGPPLLPATLRDKDRAGLAYTILYGRPGTAMPPWKDFVSEAEAYWIVDQLMMGLPDER